MSAPHASPDLPERPAGLDEALAQFERLESRLQSVLRHQRISNDFGQLALDGMPTRELLAEASRLAAEGLGTGFAKVLEYRPVENDFVILAGVGWDEEIRRHATIRADAGSPAGFAFQTDMPVLTNDLEREDRFRVPELLRAHRIESAINVIIRTSGGRWGVLETDSARKQAFFYEDAQFLRGFANILGLALSYRL